MKTDNKRNGLIDFMKFIFAVILLIFHGSPILTSKGINFPYFYRGAIAVEFFFITSGYLMAKSINKSENDKNTITNAYSFFKRKLSQFYPAFLICWLFSFIIINICCFDSFKTLTINFFESIFELLFLRNAGFNAYRVVPQTWYLSATILAMLIIYPLYKKNNKFFEGYIAPLISILILGYIFYTTKSLVNPNKHFVYFYKSTLRGLSEICLGIYCFFLCEKLKGVNFTKIGKLILSITEIFGYLFGILYMQYYNLFNSTFDFITLIFFAISITISFSNKSALPHLFRGNFWSKLGKYSLYIYLTYYAYLKVIPILFSNLTPIHMYFLYIFLTMITGLILLLLEKYMLIIIKKIKNLIVY